jgi:hypothetical protein
MRFIDFFELFGSSGVSVGVSTSIGVCSSLIRMML